MSTRTHKGISYSVEGIDKGRWKWVVRPPLSVQGLRVATGIIEGSFNDAMNLARAQIDAQLESSRGSWLLFDLPFV